MNIAVIALAISCTLLAINAIWLNLSFTILVIPTLVNVD